MTESDPALIPPHICTHQITLYSTNTNGDNCLPQPIPGQHRQLLSCRHFVPLLPPTELHPSALSQAAPIHSHILTSDATHHPVIHLDLAIDFHVHRMMYLWLRSATQRYETDLSIHCRDTKTSDTVTLS